MLLDARRGLNLKCRELFRDEKIADAIYRCLCDGIEECEAVQPEQKAGKWEPIMVFDGYVDFRCSACHRYRFHNGEMRKKYKFCPNCGADMRGEQDGRNDIDT